MEHIDFLLNHSLHLGMGDTKIGSFPKVRVQAFRAAHSDSSRDMPFGAAYSEHKRRGPPITVEHGDWTALLTGYGSDLAGELYFNRDHCLELFRCPYEGLILPQFSGHKLCVGLITPV